MREGNFWDGFYGRLGAEVEKAGNEKRKVGGLSVLWRLVVLPVVIFVKSLVSGRKRGRAKLREALHESVFSFAVNARLYELEKADSSELAKIKTQWNKSKPSADA